ncbi:hypothetical protein Sjap_020506 [Stephania japonica]|uniref:Cytochrome P450 n=1 Tax=Stephania japonica TaxID=461633 RepID=A0AAP0F3K8_9MAGN
MTNLSERLTSVLSQAWSWWSEGLNRKDEWARTALTVSSLALFIMWFTWINKLYKSRNARYPPGPRGLPLVGNLPFLDPDLHTYFARLADTYGPILKLRLGKKVAVVVTSPALAKQVLKDHDTTFANRDVPVAGKIATYGGLDIAWTPYGPEWRMLRKVCVREMLSNTSLDGMYSLRKREVEGMVREIHGKVGSPVNLGEQLFLTILNIITSMLWGGHERITSLGTEFKEVVGEITKLLGTPNVSDFFPGLARYDLQGLDREMRASALKFDRIFEYIIEERLKLIDSEKGVEIKDFLHMLLRLKDEGGTNTPFTMKHLKALLMDMVVGGTDTTSNTVEWAIAELMNKRETMRKAQEELETVVGLDSKLEESHLPKLHYLQAVMKEVLRLHPALPLLVPHCPSSACDIGGYTVPEGARVFINVWAIHRDPSIWDNPLEFNPERFLNVKWDFSGNDFNYLPFGSGRRICAGISMGERMFMYELATLLHSFDWELPPNSKLDLKEKFGIVLKKATPMIAIPSPRLSKPALYT